MFECSCHVSPVYCLSAFKKVRVPFFKQMHLTIAFNDIENSIKHESGFAAYFLYWTIDLIYVFEAKHFNSFIADLKNI